MSGHIFAAASGGEAATVDLSGLHPGLDGARVVVADVNARYPDGNVPPDVATGAVLCGGAMVAGEELMTSIAARGGSDPPGAARCLAPAPGSREAAADSPCRSPVDPVEAGPREGRP